MTKKSYFKALCLTILPLLIVLLTPIYLVSPLSVNIPIPAQVYGEMWYMNHTGTTIAFASANVSYPLFFTNAEKLNGFSFVGGFNLSSNLTAQFAGIYKANYLASGSGQNNHNYFTTVLINGLEQNNCMSHKKMTAGGDIVTMTGSCLINLVVGDNVQLSTMDYDGTGTGKYYAGNLNLVRIGN